MSGVCPGLFGALCEGAPGGPVSVMPCCIVTFLYCVFYGVSEANRIYCYGKNSNVDSKFFARKFDSVLAAIYCFVYSQERSTSLARSLFRMRFLRGGASQLAADVAIRSGHRLRRLLARSAFGQELQEKKCRRRSVAGNARMKTAGAKKSARRFLCGRF